MKTHNPSISVIVPVYNREHSITQALESVKSQTYKNFEVIIVDDGSTDDTAAQVKSFLSDERFTYWYQPNSGKPSCARNSGIRHAKYDWVAFLDSDDHWLPNKLEQQVNVLEALDNVDLVFSDCQLKLFQKDQALSLFSVTRVRQDLDLIESEYCEFGRAFNPEKLQTVLCKTGFIMTQGVLVKKVKLEEAGLFDDTLTYSEDTDLWLTLARSCKLAQSFGRLFYYNQGQDSITVDIKDAYYTDKFKVLSKHRHQQSKSVNKRLLLRREIGYRIEYAVKTKSLAKTLLTFRTAKAFLNDPQSAVKSLKIIVKEALRYQSKQLPTHKAKKIGN